jgi:hypothetical protein
MGIFLLKKTTGVLNGILSALSELGKGAGYALKH